MDDSSHGIRQRAFFARAIGRITGKGTLALFGSSALAVDFKSDQSPVTQADRRAEEQMRRAIERRFPEDGILGEEFGLIEGRSGFRWVLDPIDGTKSFVAGVPLYGTMVGLEYQGRAVAGVVYFPPLDQMVFASRGEGCWTVCGAGPPRRATVSRQTELASARLVLTDSRSFQNRVAANTLGDLQQVVHQVRTWGDCYGYYLVATGRAELMIDPKLQVWDAVPVQPIIEEAGGVFCDWQGRACTDSGDALAANRQLVDQVLPYLEGPK
jgi:histidinol phosphatase-like enzyme (inositol monophosphatase family)